MHKISTFFLFTTLIFCNSSIFAQFKIEAIQRSRINKSDQDKLQPSLNAPSLSLASPNGKTGDEDLYNGDTTGKNHFLICLNYELNDMDSFMMHNLRSQEDYGIFHHGTIVKYKQNQITYYCNYRLIKLSDDESDPNDPSNYIAQNNLLIIQMVNGTVTKKEEHFEHMTNYTSFYEDFDGNNTIPDKVVVVSKKSSDEETILNEISNLEAIELSHKDKLIQKLEFYEDRVVSTEWVD